MSINYMKNGLYFLLMVCLLGCDDYIRTEVVENIYVNKSSISAFVGDKVQLTASPTDGTYIYQWSSENPEIALVNSSGLVEVVGEGFTTIIVSQGNVKTRINVNASIRIPLEDVLLSETILEMLPGNKKIITVIMVPENANDISEIFWSSENPNIATVNESGEINVVNEGETNIVFQIGDILKKVEVNAAFTRPFKGPHTLSNVAPYILPAANFDFGGEGHAFHDSNAENPIGNDNYRTANGDSQSFSVEIEGDGANIGYINAGEWLLYTVDVQDAGEYLVDISLSAAGDNGRFYLEVDGTNVTGSVSIPNNGSWSNWLWYPGTPLVISLNEGKRKIKFFIEESGFNLRALRFTKQ